MNNPYVVQNNWLGQVAQVHQPPPFFFRTSYIDLEKVGDSKEVHPVIAENVSCEFATRALTFTFTI